MVVMMQPTNVHPSSVEKGQSPFLLPSTFDITVPDVLDALEKTTCVGKAAGSASV